MKNLAKFSVFVFLFFVSLFAFVGCDKIDRASKSNFKATIGEVNYGSLTEAVAGAKDGDTIKIYDDLNDHKNIIINKPIRIEGVVSANQVKPKFYGSLTIDLDGDDESVSIEDIEIVHDGTKAEGENNNTLIGINLVNGGLEFKKSKVGLNDASQPDKGASGMIVSRKPDSTSVMPINIEGNCFDVYETDGETLSGGLLIFSGGDYQKIKLNEGEIYDSNVFVATSEGNMFISIDFSLPSEVYSYFVTSSTDELVDALSSKQAKNGSNFTLIAFSPIKKKAEEPIVLSAPSILTIDGNNKANFKDSTLQVFGVLRLNADVENLKIERGVNKQNGAYGSIITKEGVDSKVLSISSKS